MGGPGSDQGPWAAHGVTGSILRHPWSLGGPWASPAGPRHQEVNFAEGKLLKSWIVTVRQLEMRCCAYKHYRRVLENGGPSGSPETTGPRAGYSKLSWGMQRARSAILYVGILQHRVQIRGGWNARGKYMLIHVDFAGELERQRLRNYVFAMDKQPITS